MAPHSEYTTRPDILYDAAALAAESGARMQVHLAETRKEQLECVGRHGKTPTQVLRDAGVLENPVTLAHGVWLTDADMEIIAHAGEATVAHCAKSNLKLASGVAQVTNCLLYTSDRPNRDPLLFRKNKWLLAHTENNELIQKGAQAGIYGVNIRVMEV